MADRLCSKCGSNGPFGKDKKNADGLRCQCKKCCQEAGRKRREEHRDSILASDELYRKNNRGLRCAATQAWRAANKEADATTRRARYEANSEMVKSQVKRWYKDHPEEAAARFHTRRARVMKNGGTYTASEWKMLLDMTGHRCLACGTAKEKLTVDHVIPIAKGGSNTIDNLQPLCLACNLSKGTKVIDYRSTLSWA